MHALKLGLIIANQELWNEVQASLRNLPVRVSMQQPALGDTAAFLEQVEAQRLDLLLIDLKGSKEPFEQIVRKVKALPSAPMVIALSESAQPQTILAALRAGANEFLYPPLEDTLHAALERLSAERARLNGGTRQRGKVLGFVSAKGGCGATTIACHIAVEIQRVTMQDVLLADFDMDSGMVGFLMQAASQYSVLDAVHNVHRLDQSYWKAIVSNGRQHLEVISAPAVGSVREYPQVDPMRDVLRFVRTLYEWVIVDLGRSLSPVTLGVIEDIDDTYLVGTMDLPSLHQSKQVAQGLLDLGHSRDRLHLVLNRTPRRPDFAPGEVEKVIGIPVYEMLPNDYPELYEAYTEGTLLPATSELGKSLAGLAQKIVGVQAKEKVKARSSLSIFSF